MAHFELKMNDGYVDIENIEGVSITLEADKTYTIGTDDEIRVYASATKPAIEEGYIVKRGSFAYTHETGKKLWVKALSYPVARITI